jgi:hypothetical protein
MLDLSLFSLLGMKGVTRGVTGALLFSSLACSTAPPPLVTESEGSWQHQYEVESGLVQESGRCAGKPRGSTALHEETLQSQPPLEVGTGEQIVHVFADVFAFPLRGVGWVVQKIF